jgi:hypothetical protein
MRQWLDLLSGLCKPYFCLKAYFIVTRLEMPKISVLLLVAITVVSVWGNTIIDPTLGVSHVLTPLDRLNLTMADTNATFSLAIEEVTPYVEMGIADTFGIIAYSTVTNTGASTCIGDLGLSPGSAVDGGITIQGGAQEVDTPEAVTAMDAANTARVTLQGLPCDVTFSSSQGNLAGLTLTPGVYCWTPPNVLLQGGDLILDARGQLDAHWVFNIAGILTVGAPGAPNSVFMINGGSSCNVYWVTGGKTLMYLASHMIGTLIAYSQINFGVGGSVQGRTFALTDQVTLQANVIDDSLCNPETFNRTSMNITVSADIGTPPVMLPYNSTLIEFGNVAGFNVTAIGGAVGAPLSITIDTPSVDDTLVAILADPQTVFGLLYLAPGASVYQPMQAKAVTSSNGGLSLLATSGFGLGSYYFAYTNRSIIASLFPSPSSSTGESSSADVLLSSSSSSGVAAVVAPSSTGSSSSSSSSTAVHHTRGNHDTMIVAMWIAAGVFTFLILLCLYLLCISTTDSYSVL